jgi:hypothetical protein
LVPLGAMLASTVLVSEVFDAAIALAAFKSIGDAIAAEPAIKNFLLLRFEFISVMICSPFYNLFMTYSGSVARPVLT